MNTRSPFSITRFEYEVRPLYYLQEDLYSTLQRSKPCYLLGSRGTGKTTLLRSLSWRERLHNKSLYNQLGRDVFSAFIGIYIKLPTIQIDAISLWLIDSIETTKRTIYSRYLELVQLQEIFESVAELEAAGQLEYSASLEQRAVRRLVEEYENELCFDEKATARPISFSDLSNSVRQLRRYIEKASQSGESPTTVLQRIGNPVQLGNLSREITRHLCIAISKGKEATELAFKVCFDEAETLDAFGVKVLATWVRLSTGSLNHVISFASKPDSLSDTLLPNLTVQSADVTLLDLDCIKDNEFRAFAEGVTTLRLMELWRAEPDERPNAPLLPFDTEQLFGKLNINFLLEDALRQSVAPVAKELLREASLRAGEISNPNATKRSRKGDDAALPIYETYLELKTKRQLPDSTAPKWTKRRATSQLTRKPMIAAYLSIMHELHTAPRYAYADMILQLSDSCIRDFLNNLEYMFQKSKMPIWEFINLARVKITVQSSGLLDASRAKFKSLPIHGVNHPSSTAKLVNGLGRTTHLLQTRSADGIRHLRSTERGIFTLTLESKSDAMARAIRLVIDAAEAGFLKLVSGEELTLSFRVHTSLAPAFQLSYRGAYYPAAILATDILSFADAADDNGIDRLANGLFERLDNVRPGDLFSELKQ